MKNFEDITTEKIYYVEVYDYKMNRTYRSLRTFESYDLAESFIKTYDFQSDFACHPIGIYITDSIKLNFGFGNFNECK